jgi:hypothetical protein
MKAAAISRNNLLKILIKLHGKHNFYKWWLNGLKWHEVFLYCKILWLCLFNYLPETAWGRSRESPRLAPPPDQLANQPYLQIYFLFLFLIVIPLVIINEILSNPSKIFRKWLIWEKWNSTILLYFCSHMVNDLQKKKSFIFIIILKTILSSDLRDLLQFEICGHLCT